MQSTATDVLIGGIAGVVATVAMTIFADALFRRLPKDEQYPLPPRELTDQAMTDLGVRHQMSEPALKAATLASHFGFGAAVGSAYPSLLLGNGVPPLVSGIAYGLAVWTFSYLGWVPAVRWLRPATSHPLRRNALMVASHVVWGSVLGLTSLWLSRCMRPISGGTVNDR